MGNPSAFLRNISYILSPTAFPFTNLYFQKGHISMPSTRTNWHEAVTCAIQIDLRDYSHLLKYHEEYFLDSNNNYIDLLVIKKNSEFQIPKHIASIFQSYNLFETKGLGSSLTTDAYYKTNGHACYYINTYPQTNGLTRKNITLTFPTFHYPRNLLNHLTK